MVILFPTGIQLADLSAASPRVSTVVKGRLISKSDKDVHDKWKFNPEILHTGEKRENSL